jgi:quercetin dioxygenase-like cupin family protein
MWPVDRSDILVRPGGGETITDREGRQVSILAAWEELTITGFRLGPGEEGPEPHVHHEHTDAFYVLEGQLGLALGPARERIQVGAGGLVAAPPNVLHTFINDSSAEVRFLNLHAPDGGFAAYMRARRDGDEQASFDTFDPPADGGLPLSAAIVADSGEGERLVQGNRAATLKGVLHDLCVAEFEYDGPVAGPRPHAHDAQVDSFYVLEGELEMTIEESQHPAGPGTLASLPRGVLHTFAHTAAGTARVLNLHAPDGGFGEFLRRVYS